MELVNILTSFFIPNSLISLFLISILLSSVTILLSFSSLFRNTISLNKRNIPKIIIPVIQATSIIIKIALLPKSVEFAIVLSFI